MSRILFNYKPKVVNIQNMEEVYNQLSSIYSSTTKSTNTRRISNTLLLTKERRRFTLVDEKPDILMIIAIVFANDEMTTEISGGSHWGNCLGIYSSYDKILDLDEMKESLKKNMDFYDEFLDVINAVKTKYQTIGGSNNAK